MPDGFNGQVEVDGDQNRGLEGAAVEVDGLMDDRLLAALDPSPESTRHLGGSNMSRSDRGKENLPEAWTSRDQTDRPTCWAGKGVQNKSECI